MLHCIKACGLALGNKSLYTKIVNIRTGKLRIFITALAVILILSGAYVLVVALSPLLLSPTIDPTDNRTTELIEETKDHISEQRLYIPKIDVNVPYSDSGELALEDGAWWRQSHNGNPKDGGNFVLSAHRFIMGLTPQQTLRQSPFYSIGQLAVDDELIVDYEGERYTYVIREIYEVAPTAVEIEARTDEPRLTLYSCTLGGASDGREVIIATLKTS